MADTRTIHYGEGKQEITITVSAASALMGMRRAVLRGTGDAFLDSVMDKPAATAAPAVAGGMAQLDITAYLLVVRFQYPDLQAVVVRATGIELPLSPQEFCELPVGLVDVWDEAVYALNPHWLPTSVNDNDEKANAPQKKRKPVKKSGSD